MHKQLYKYELSEQIITACMCKVSTILKGCIEYGQLSVLR